MGTSISVGILVSVIDCMTHAFRSIRGIFQKIEVSEELSSNSLGISFKLGEL